MAVGDAESDALHARKNRPEQPPVEFPPYVYQPFPAWMHHDKEESRLVTNADQQAALVSRGWSESPQGARAAFEAYELGKSNDAAQVLADDRRLSAKARAEYDAVNDAADANVLDLPVPPAERKKPGPKPKTQE